jgi:hypothetical protein
VLKQVDEHRGKGKTGFGSALDGSFRLDMPPGSHTLTVAYYDELAAEELATARVTFEACAGRRYRVAGKRLKKDVWELRIEHIRSRLGLDPTVVVRLTVYPPVIGQLAPRRSPRRSPQPRAFPSLDAVCQDPVAYAGKRIKWVGKWMGSDVSQGKTMAAFSVVSPSKRRGEYRDTYLFFVVEAPGRWAPPASTRHRAAIEGSVVGSCRASVAVAGKNYSLDVPLIRLTPKR